ncbi:MAG TPA: TonB-dependent receptor [Salinivirga sp.]|uniref:TonB-dependent receptor n=1 Tax=Salinivirga sp. TaxID=1970192 RepID=UPI002B46EB8C|nr:TonB-dependent receptor [Salinivirga sp.]HKK58140.1 TonB-dependent receptor [Salinivirga sp.]
MRLFIIITILLLLGPIANRADNTNERKPVLSGYITDAATGEDLIGATVYVQEIGQGTITNVYGFYSISLAPGTYNVRYSFIGYRAKTFTITISDKDLSRNIELEPTAEELEEVVVTGEKSNANITKTEMSVEQLGSDDIRKIPALMGEVDIIKAIQLLPGVQTPAEGSSGFSVRGGNLDQNLILLDEANVYNASHLMGFFSVFNNDAIKDVKLYKGDIPAKYGGRLSSVLDIHMREGNNKQFSGVGGIGLISSRATIEGPLWEDRISVMASGRRTYVDLFLPLSRNEDIRNNTLFFYDLNTKINYKISNNDRVFLSGYFGRDVFGSEFARMGYGNGTGTIRWNHLFSKKLFSNLSVVYSNYYYSLGTPENEANSFLWEAGLNDLTAKYDFTYFATPRLKVNYGIQSTLHVFNPGYARGTSDSVSSLGSVRVPINRSIENGIYVGFEYKVNALLAFKGGLRNSSFGNYGNKPTYTYENSERVDTTEHSGGIYQTYFNWEPRLSMNLTLNEYSSIKASYARTTQYIQMARNGNAGTPLDIWFSASPNVKPQIGDQVALGFFRNFFDNKLKASAEVYYKWMENTIDFKDDAVLLLNEDLEGELRFGRSWAYGTELMVKFQFERFNGWASYTYSHAERKINGVNEGEPFLAPYDKPHDVSIVLNYEIMKRLSVGATWVYSSGLPATFPRGMAEVYGNYVPIYSDRNEDRYPDYHRMDLSLTWENKPMMAGDRKVESNWNLSVYNLYDRHNAWAINFEQDKQNPHKIYAEKTYLFGILPTVSFNIKF